MAEILTKRCLAAIPLLLILSIVTFSLIYSLPGDPVDILIGTAQRDIAPEELAEMRRELGLDRPPAQQYLFWLKNGVMKGELGRSYKDGRPVVTIIQERLPSTALLVGFALVIAFSLGIAWGLSMVWLKQFRGGRPLETALFSLALVAYSAPSFWVGFIALSIVAAGSGPVEMPILSVHPPGDSAGPALAVLYVILPAFVLSLRRASKVALFVRAATLDEVNKEYVVAAFSKGLGTLKVLTKHVLRNSLTPVISLVGLSLPAMLGGAVLIESVFGWPGLGRLMIEAAYGRNYPLIMGLVLTYGSVVVISNLIADILQYAADPRTLDAKADESGESAAGRSPKAGGAMA